MSENKNTATKADLEQENKELKEKISSLEEQMKAVLEALNKQAQPQAVTPVINVTAPSTDVHIKYMSDSEGYLEVNAIKLNCSRYGEEFTLTRQDADALVGKYRRWFDRGILAVSPVDVEFAAGKGVRTSDEYALSPEKLNSIGKMSCAQIEKLWGELNDEHKLSLVTYFKRMFIEGKDKTYQDREKIDCLNRLTKGGLKREAKEVSGEDLKIIPTSM